jgi:hypothetical protein
LLLLFSITIIIIIIKLLIPILKKKVGVACPRVLSKIAKKGGGRKGALEIRKKRSGTYVPRVLPKITPKNGGGRMSFNIVAALPA